MSQTIKTTTSWSSIVGRASAIVLLGTLAAASERVAWASGVHHALSRATAETSAFVLGMSGNPTYVDGASIHGLGYAIAVVPECNGLVALTLVIAGSLLARMSWRRRAAWALASATAVFLVNAIRLGTILAVGTRSASMASFAHEYVFPVAAGGLFIGLWYVWLSHLTPQETQGAIR